MDMRNRIIALLFTVGITGAGIMTCIGGGLDGQPATPSEEPEQSTQASVFDMPDSIDSTIDESVPGRYSLINVNGLFQKSMGRRRIEDSEADVYRMKNGQLIYGIDNMEDSIPLLADNTAEFCNALRANDIPLLYVQLPFKIQNGTNSMPSGTTEYANSNANKLVAELEDRGVMVMDLRDDTDDAIEYVSQLDSECASYEDLFYNTDQHWTNETALWAASRITNTIKNPKLIDNSATVTNPTNFDVERYENKFLGSFGKKTGAWYGGMDNYDLVKPVYDTDFTFTIKSRDGDIVREGSWEESMLDKSNMEGNPFEVNTYETYTGGNFAYTIAENHKSHGPRLLLIRDSFSCAMMPYLALECSELTAIDLRYLKSMTALDFALQGDYDAVVIAYNPSMFGENTFQFQ